VRPRKRAIRAARTHYRGGADVVGRARNGCSAAEDTMLFDAFWRVTDEPPFDALTASCAECYRLSIETSLAPQHRVYRMQRSPIKESNFVAHFFVFGEKRNEATARTYKITIEEPLWCAWDALLTAARFWEMPTEHRSCGLDGSTYTLEAWKAGRSHKVLRWSPSPIISGGELFALLTDYLERLGELAILECDLGIRERYVPAHVPIRQHYPRGNLA
jgi:hypothetical protein